MAELDRALRLQLLEFASGPDMIHGEALRHLGGGSKHSILTFFNKSLRTGIVPQSWRHGVIIPLLKSGKKAAELASYRPVESTSCLCKLTKRIITERIRDIIEPKLTRQQSGFRPSHSTLDQLLHLRAVMRRPAPKDKMAAVFVDYAKAFDTVDNDKIILEMRRLKDRTAAVFVDYAKAFDTVDNDKIILEMRRLGIPQHIVRWSASFLGNRTAVVRVNKVHSSPASFTRGVPQGTVLGPLMFIIVMNSFSIQFA
ncbi:hypothetical protein DQ04_05911080 [Trypanosoma grayi]|uniref:hypothetical protein n=1 Tax=Trypanosoma grayi TaxID=71804 RepID=UPI0004F42875|nr:hypothetical protein DQ04_05911080 [Trypanosoma grayi]KEG09058.1 hypothetical protein DQ04_05911080 [Trypanosoma grayi]